VQPITDSRVRPFVISEYVRWGDIDLAGIIRYSAYLRFFELAETEGPARRGHPHPRGLGSFPRILGHYVREKKALTLPQAIHKMTGFPAARVKLAGRGRLVSGLAGDVVVFDPATVRDRATFTEPFQYPEGIRAVIVNGQIALRDGVRTEVRSGQALRAS
jgi:N-acyl-D-aspartate/D-glutamate deacylase